MVEDVSEWVGEHSNCSKHLFIFASVVSCREKARFCVSGESSESDLLWLFSLFFTELGLGCSVFT